jgi:hypothetical protein
MGVGPIYVLGYWNSWSAGADTDKFDPLELSTLLRWRNYDYFSLPASLYLADKPSWFGSVAWPAIGPDVSGMSNKLPAQLCYESNNLGGGAFDASRCY